MYAEQQKVTDLYFYGLAGEDDSTKTPVVKKKKQVRFGGPLSPELFDKNLPPSTPLQKGGTPARAATPGGNLQLRSLLKTPPRSESRTPQCHSDLYSPTGVGASPTLAMPRTRRMQSEGDDDGIKDGKVDDNNMPKSCFYQQHSCGGRYSLYLINCCIEYLDLNSSLFAKICKGIAVLFVYSLST